MREKVLPIQKSSPNAATKAASPARRVVAQSSSAASGRAKQRVIKQLLVEAAVELFQARGFDAVTITEIADAVGIARRTFFLYFATKEDVLLQRLNDEWHLATEMLLTHHASKTPFEAYAGALLELGAHLDSDRERALTITRITLENPSVFGREYANQHGWETRWAQRLREVQRQPASRALTYEVQAAAAFAVVAVAARRWTDDPKRQKFCLWLERGFSEIRALGSDNKNVDIEA